MSPLQLSQHGETLSLLQITDPHLFAEPASQLQGIVTRDSLHAVLEQIRQQHDVAALDAVICTGDITQDQTFQAYQAFADMVGALGRPVFCVPGNHDMPARMKTAAPGSKCSPGVLETRHWRLVLLNSHAGPVPYGHLADEEFARLEQALTAEPEKPVAVFVHHNPVPVGSRWLDQHILRNGNELIDRLSAHSNARAVIWGHVHQAQEQHWRGLHLLSTPSTCVQFRPNCEQYTLDQAQPGYRLLQLHAGGSLTTQVHRLPAGSFLPDPEASGY